MIVRSDNDGAGTPCARIRAQTSAWLDGERADAGALDEHWRSCPECARYADGLRALRGSFRAIQAAEPPNHMWASIAQRVQPRSKVPRPRGWLRVAAGLLGFIGTLVALKAAHPRVPSDVPAELGAALSRLSTAHAPAGAQESLSSLPEHHLLNALYASTEERR